MRVGRGRGQYLARRQFPVEDEPSSSDSEYETPPQFRRRRYDAKEKEGESDADDFFDYISKKMEDLKLAALNKTMSEKEGKEEGVPSVFFKFNPKLKRFEQCFFNWIPEESSFTREDATHVADKLDGKFRNVTLDLIMKELKACPFETISHKLICAFCHLTLEDHESGERLQGEIATLIKLARTNAYISFEHCEGFQYLADGLEAFKRSLVDKDEALEEYLRSSTKYAELSEEAKQSVKGALGFFYGTIRYNREYQISLFKELAIEDPNTIDWKLNVLFVVRQQRRETDRLAYPSDEEREMIRKCLESNPDHVLVKLAVCAFLGDALRNRAPGLAWRPNIDGPLTLTDKISFSDYKAVAAYVKAASKDMLEAMEYSVKINLYISEVFTIALPNHLRDLKIGKECLIKALQMNPESSKGNHRMGLHYLVNEQKYLEAKHFFEKAFEADSRNFPALIDLLQVMLHDIEAYEDKFKEILEEQTRNDYWTNNRRGSLHVLQGIFCFMKKDYDECVKNWRIADSLDDGALDNLNRLTSYIFRYGWDCSKIDPKDVEGVLQRKLHVLYGKPDDYDLCGCVERALESLRNGIQRAEKRAFGISQHLSGGMRQDNNWRSGSQENGRNAAQENGRNAGQRNWRDEEKENWRNGVRGLPPLPPQEEPSSRTMTAGRGRGNFGGVNSALEDFRVASRRPVYAGVADADANWRC